jgi:hypothetical protein
MAGLARVLEALALLSFVFVAGGDSGLRPGSSEGAKALLQGEFEDWAIHVSVYRGFTSDITSDITSVRPEYIGGVATYATRPVVQVVQLRTR